MPRGDREKIPRGKSIAFEVAWTPRTQRPRWAAFAIRIRSSRRVLEVLDGALVTLGGRAGRERAEVPPTPGAWVLLARIQTITAGGQFPDHVGSSVMTCLIA